MNRLGYAAVHVDSLAGMRCAHDCVTCDYIAGLLRSSQSFTLSTSGLEVALVHVAGCMTGAATAAECRTKSERLATD